MPTGYTADVESGKVTELREFVLRCARAMGACITMRDDPMDAPIPDEFTASDWNARQLEVAERRLREVSAWSDVRAELHANADYAEVVTRRSEQLIENVEQQARYAAMLVKVEGWGPPTSEHQGLKDFMRQQLEESMRFGSSTPGAPVRQTGAEYKAAAIERAERDIAYHTKGQREEDERTAARNAWVKALRESLR